MHNIIAIDGPASSEKSTLANLISKIDVPVLHSAKFTGHWQLMLRNKININSHREILMCIKYKQYSQLQKSIFK